VDPQAAMEFHQAAGAAGIDLRARPISQFTSVTGVFRTLIDLPEDVHAASICLHARASN
jgi:3-oxoacyl-[acyl-carrier protein] reductase